MNELDRQHERFRATSSGINLKTGPAIELTNGLDYAGFIDRLKGVTP